MLPIGSSPLRRMCGRQDARCCLRAVLIEQKKEKKDEESEDKGFDEM